MVELPEPFATPPVLVARQATEALRGYVYQIYASALAWLDLTENNLLLLEALEQVGDRKWATSVQEWIADGGPKTRYLHFVEGERPSDQPWRWRD